MALQFPTDAVDGDLYPLTVNLVAGGRQWKYNATDGIWEIVSPHIGTNSPDAFNSYVFPDEDGSLADSSLTTDASGNLAWRPRDIPQIVYLKFLEEFDGIEVNFTLLKASDDTPFTPSDPENLSCFIAGVPQDNGTSFTVSGNTVTFSEPVPANAHSFIFSIATVPES